MERHLIVRNVIEDRLKERELMAALRRWDGTCWPPGAPREVVVEYPARLLWNI
jgi:hypothetical protein